MKRWISLFAFIGIVLICIGIYSIYQKVKGSPQKRVVLMKEIEVPAKAVWFDTGIDVTGQEVQVQYMHGMWTSGGVNPLWANAESATLSKLPGLMVPSAKVRALVGKTTEGHMLIGSSQRIQNRTGKLYLGMDITTYLQVTSHRELKQIDLQAREIEYKQDQEQVSRVQQETPELIDRATHRLYSMYEQRKQLEASTDPAKDDKLNQLNYNIGIAERLIRGEQDRYLEAALGQEAVRNLPPQDGSGRTESEEGEGQESISKRGRGRPRKNPPEQQGA